MAFDREKLKAVVLHVCAKCEPSHLGAVKLHKVLYFADMLHYANTGKPITGATYRKRRLGPTCEQLLSVLSELESGGNIAIRFVDYFGYRKKEFEAKAFPETNHLSADELLMINEVVEFVCESNSAKTISEFSHNRAWELAEFGDVIKYNSVFHIFPTQTSSEAMDWADAEVKRVAAERPQKDTLDRPLFGVLRARVLEALRH